MLDSAMLTPSQFFLGQGILPQLQGPSSTTRAHARKAAMALIRHKGIRGFIVEPQLQDDAFQSGISKKDLLMKRARRGGDEVAVGPAPKKTRVEESATSSEPTPKKAVECDSSAKILPSKEGLLVYGENDVLCGRGGSTNVHSGNKLFRDLVNSRRRDYLRATKNDKPDISRSVVHAVRKVGGRFLKRDERAGGLWYEIGDDAAREKASQALRQRAPEMRRLLYRDEYNQEEIVYSDGSVPAVYHPNPAENAYLRSLTEAMFRGKDKGKQLKQESPSPPQIPSSLASLDVCKDDLQFQSRYGGAGIGSRASLLHFDPQVLYLRRRAHQLRMEALLEGRINRFIPREA